MQKRGEWLFRVRRESYRVNQKNAPDRLLHAFPAMMAARWADAATICPIAGLIETKAGCVRRKTFQLSLSEMAFKFLSPFPLVSSSPLCPPLSPTTPITPYNPPNIFRAPPFPPRVFSASAGVICAGVRVDGAGCATIVQK